MVSLLSSSTTQSCLIFMVSMSMGGATSCERNNRVPNGVFVKLIESNTLSASRWRSCMLVLLLPPPVIFTMSTRKLLSNSKWRTVSWSTLQRQQN